MITCNSCIWKIGNSLPFLESHFPEYFTAGDSWLSFWIIWFYDVNVLSRPSSSSRSNMICRWYSCSPGPAMISDITCLYIMPLLQECQESPHSYFFPTKQHRVKHSLKMKIVLQKFLTRQTSFYDKTAKWIYITNMGIVSSLKNIFDKVFLLVPMSAWIFLTKHCQRIYETTHCCGLVVYISPLMKPK